MDRTTRPILVTGAHRSGSTWVGHMICESRAVGYVHEPFNPTHRPGICRASFQQYFTYLDERNAAGVRQHLERCLRFEYQAAAELRVVRSAKDVARLLRDSTRFLIARLEGRRAVMKDPIALFSAEWLARTFEMDVVVLIRHPAAFVGSIKKANWKFPFGDFLEQPLLMEQYLGPFRRQIEEYASREVGVIDQAILLWNVIHHVILNYRQRHRNWIFIKHEDLSANPVREFGVLFQRLGLDYPPAVQKRIARHSDPRIKGDKHLLKRDSRSNVWTWQSRLTEEEIERVKQGTRQIAWQIYRESDWNLHSQAGRQRAA